MARGWVVDILAGMRARYTTLVQSLIEPRRRHPRTWRDLNGPGLSEHGESLAGPGRPRSLGVATRAVRQHISFIFGCPQRYSPRDPLGLPVG